MNYIPCRCFLSLLLLGIWAPGRAQPPGSYTQEISMTTENDNYLFNFNDRYYTNGLILEYRFILPDTGSMAKQNISKRILTFGIGQKIYTPTDINILEYHDYDRPYAGWLFTASTLSYFLKKQTAVNFSLELGVTGSYSLAEKVQKWWHRLVDYTEPAGWDHQIANGVGLNFTTAVTKAWVVNNYLDIISTSTLQIGTHNQNGSQEFALRIGAFYSLDHSAQLNGGLASDNLAINHSSEHYALIGVRFHSVLHNALIQGDLWPNYSPHLEKPNPNFNSYHLGWVSSFKNYTIKLTAYYLTPEVHGGSDHMYGSILLSFRIK